MFRLAVWLILIASVAGSAMGQANPSCPWLALGTAEQLLGGKVTLFAQVDSLAAGSCSFRREGGEVNASIEVLVGPTDTHPCPQGSPPLKALGNEAIQCHHNISASQQSDQIAGRIRNVYFVVTLTNVAGARTPEPSDPHLADAYAASPVERVAEQVVGNLY
jgi:hypothetical protein